MVEPVGITLAAIALADQVYERLDKLWRVYKVSQAFGEDFRRSYVKLQGNEQLFKTYLESFNKYLQAKAKTKKWQTQNALRLRVKEHIEAMVNDFNASYDIVETYTKASRFKSQHGRGGC
jgi:methionyl-tRNA synthetase